MPRKSVRTKKQTKTTAALTATKSSSNENKPAKSNENKQPASNKPLNENQPTNLNAKADEPSKSAPEKSAKPASKLTDFLKSPNGIGTMNTVKSEIDDAKPIANPTAAKSTAKPIARPIAKSTASSKPANGTKATNGARSATAKSTTRKTKSAGKKSQSGQKKESTLDKSTNHLITEYYKVTKRKTSNQLKEEQEQLIGYYIKNDIDDVKSLKIEEFEDKGRGIVTRRRFSKGSFICEYRGDLIDIGKAKERERLYESQELGCYMYYFSWSNKHWCIDATADTGRLGRLINHSRKRPNLRTKLFILNNEPHLIFLALDDIEEGTELLYDYGEKERDVIEANPWIRCT